MAALTRLILTAALRAHPGRTVVGIVAIAIGVAMGYAVYLINHAALTEFTQAARALSGEADLEIRGPRSGFDEALYARLARLPEVAVASPVVAVEASLPARRETLDILGVDVFRAMAINPGLAGASSGARASRLDSLDPSVVFLSPAALAWLHLKPGEMLHVRAGSGVLSLRVAGTLPVTSAGLRLGVMDIGAAQWRFGMLGRLQRIDLRLRPGVDVAAFRGEVAALLPPGVVADTPEDTRHLLSNLSLAYRVNLNVLALVALFTGAFLVFSGQSLSVLSRRAQLALLRALGVTRRGLLRLIVAESLVLGMAGAALGVLLGALLAAAVLRYGGGDLGGGYFPGVQPTLRLGVPAALSFFALGVAAAVLGGTVPAWEVSSASPAAALKAGDDGDAATRMRTVWPALALVAAGVALTGAGPVDGLPLFAYLSIALLLTGTVLWIPHLARWVFRILPRPHRAVPFLATAQLAGAPRRMAIGLAGVVVSFGLMAAMAIMVSSFRGSFEAWLDTVLPAQLYLRAGGGGTTGYFSDEERRALAALPGIENIEFMRTDQLTLNPRLPPVALIVRPIDPRHPEKRLALLGATVDPATGPPPVWVSEAMVDLYGMRVGAHIELPLAGQRRAFTVAGVWRDYARQFGAIVMSTGDARRFTGGLRATEAALWLAPHTTVAQAARAIRERLQGAGRIEFESAGDMRAASVRIFDRSFAVTYLLEGVAIVIGVFGVAVSFGAQALARAREFGMLRHIGVTRAQVGLVLAIEGALLGLLGVVMGLVLGWGVALILVTIVNPQSFHWTMSMHTPWGLLGAAALALLAAASLTAVISGRRVMSGEVVRAVREDW